MYRCTPFLVWSVLEPLSVIWIVEGADWLSTAMSIGVKCHFGSNDAAEGTVISPERRKAKNPKQQAAQSIILLKSYGFVRRLAFITLKM